MSALPKARKKFVAVLIKPSHYDDEGYVIQFWRSFIPANTLAVLYSLISDCADKRVFGEDVDFEILPIDELNTKVEPHKLIEKIKGADGGFVGMVGVQSNQYPRALDLAREFRAAQIPVVIGGFHVSGSISMLPGIQPELQEAISLGVTLFAGESEGRMADLLRDIWNGTTKPIYNYMNDLPNVEGAPTPYLPADVAKKVAGWYSSFDSGRGCPFQCSFCTIINVQGRVSRHRSPDDIAQAIRANSREGVKRFIITDDNFARNAQWEAILDKLIELRKVEKIRMKYFIQVDALSYKIPGFIDKCKKAGISTAFIGIESVNPDNLVAMKKLQNRLDEYRLCIQAWKRAGVTVIIGYIVGMPNDTRETMLRDIKVIQDELPVDIIEMLILTPLPGSEDHQKLFEKQVAMDADLNSYDLYHVVKDHEKMSRKELRDAYHEAYLSFFSEEHVERILRRSHVNGRPAHSLVYWMCLYHGSMYIEHVHPMEAGLIRRRHRHQRRPGLPIESRFVFYPKRVREMSWKGYQWFKLWRRNKRIANKIERDPLAMEYTDLALRPPSESDETDLHLLTDFEDTRRAFKKRVKAAVEADREAV